MRAGGRPAQYPHTREQSQVFCLFSLKMEIIPKALGGPEKLAALIYKGNHPASFK